MKYLNLKLTNVLRYCVFICVLVLAAFYHLGTLSSFHPWGPDFAQYIGQAIGIVDGLEYLEVFRIDGDLPLYPWGFPLLLAPIYAIWGFNLTIMKVMVTSFFLLSLPLILILFKDRLTFISRLAIILFFVLNPFHNQFKNNVLSDFPYMFFSLLSIYLIQRVFIDEKRLFRYKPIDYVIVGMIVSFTCQIRTQGYILVPILLFAQFIKYRKENSSNLPVKREDWLIELLPIGIIFVVVVSLKLLIPIGDDSYIPLLKEMFNTSWIFKNLKYYTFLPIDYLQDRKISAMIYGVSIYFIVLGIASRIKKDYIYILFIVGTMAILIIWPFQQGSRFILSIVPYYLYFLFRGLENAGKEISLIKSSTHRKVIYPLLAGILFLILFMPRLIDSYQYNIKHEDIGKGPYTVESQLLFDFIEQETENDAVIMFKKPPVISLFANRKAIREQNDIEAVKSSNADFYIYFTGLSNDTLLNDIRENQDEFQLIYQTTNVELFKFIIQ